MIDGIGNSRDEKKDIEIRKKILIAFQWNWNTLNDTITVTVENGWVILTGDVEWNYQKEAAKEAVANLFGVKGISNSITIKSQSDSTIDKKSLEHALQNHHAIDTKNIEVEVTNTNITLKGIVDTWYQKEIAGRIAWKAPGVLNVDNELVIEEE